MDAGEETRGGGAAAGGALGFGGERDGEGTSATTGSEIHQVRARARRWVAHSRTGRATEEAPEVTPSHRTTERIAGAAERRDDANIGGSSAVASDGREGRHEARDVNPLSSSPRYTLVAPRESRFLVSRRRFHRWI